jgi:hypothetical protein
MRTSRHLILASLAIGLGLATAPMAIAKDTPQKKSEEKSDPAPQPTDQAQTPTDQGSTGTETPPEAPEKGAGTDSNTQSGN